MARRSAWRKRSGGPSTSVPPPHSPQPEPYHLSLPFEWRQPTRRQRWRPRGKDRGVIKRFIDFIFFSFFCLFTSCRRTLISSRRRRDSRFVEDVRFLFLCFFHIPPAWQTLTPPYNLLYVAGDFGDVIFFPARHD